MSDAHELYHFISDNNVEITVDWEIASQSSVLRAMILTIRHIFGDVDGPLYIPISGRLMEKMFAFGDFHRNDAFCYQCQNCFFLTEDDYDVLEINDQFTYDSLIELLMIAIDLGYLQLENAVIAYIMELHESSSSASSESQLEIDLDDDEDLTPEEMEELRARIDWITRA